MNAQAYAAVDGIKEKLTNYYQAHDFMREDFNLIVNMVTDELHKLQEAALVAEVKRLRAAATTSRAEVRREALEEAAKVICPWCRDDSWSVTSYHDGFGKVREHMKIGERYTPRCAATPIYQLIAADQQGQGQEKGVQE